MWGGVGREERGWEGMEGIGVNEGRGRKSERVKVRKEWVEIRGWKKGGMGEGKM